jgi:hypothetical protein
VPLVGERPDPPGVGMLDDEFIDRSGPWEWEVARSMEMVGVDGEAGVKPSVLVLVKGGTPAWVDEVNVGLVGEVEIGSRRSLVSPAGKG